MERVQTVLEGQQDLMFPAILQSPQGFLLVIVGNVVQNTWKEITQTEVFDKHDAHWKLKAYNGRVVCAWLAHATVKLMRANPNPETIMLADCMSLPKIFLEPKKMTEARKLRAQHQSCTATISSIAPRSNANAVQSKVEAAGRYL